MLIILLSIMKKTTDFEHYCANLYKSMGYNVFVTPY